MDGRQDTRAGIIAAASRGDRDALRAVWEAHRRWVAAVLLATKPREADLDDLLQQVATQLVRRISELREPEAFKPWLRAVAVNTARADARKANTARRILPRVAAHHADAHDPATDTPVPEAAAARDEAGRLLALARSLPDGYAEPLLLRCVQGLTYRQIGEILDLPETTIETRIARGRRMLRELASQPASQSASQPANQPAAEGATP